MGVVHVAVVGLGWWGRKVVSDLTGSDIVDVVLGIDPSEVARQSAVSAGVAVAADFEHALQAPEVEAVILCTPHRFHVDQIEAAARAGKHVFCEKPLAATASDARRAIDAATRAGVVLGVGHERRFEPAVAELRRQCADGSLGQPLVFEGNFSQDKFLALDPDNWRLSAEDAPVGPLSATGIHLVDLAIALLGQPQWVLARLSNRATGFANGDTLTLQIGFAEDRAALITACLATPFVGRVCLLGSRGWVEIRDREHPEDPQGWDVTTRVTGERPNTRFYPPHPSVRANLEAFARAVDGTDTYPIAPSELLATVAAFEAIGRSVRSGHVEDIDY